MSIVQVIEACHNRATVDLGRCNSRSNKLVLAQGQPPKRTPAFEKILKETETEVVTFMSSTKVTDKRSEAFETRLRHDSQCRNGARVVHVLRVLHMRALSSCVRTVSCCARCASPVSVSSRVGAHLFFVSGTLSVSRQTACQRKPLPSPKGDATHSVRHTLLLHLWCFAEVGPEQKLSPPCGLEKGTNCPGDETGLV